MAGAARAWRLARVIHRPDQEATLDAYVVHAPWAHPEWSWWVMSVVHLRPIDGVRPAIVES